MATTPILARIRRAGGASGKKFGEHGRSRPSTNPEKIFFPKDG